MDERDIFMLVIQAPDRAQGAELVNELCGQDHVLRQRVESLLDVHGRAVSFLESPPADFLATNDQTCISELPGMVIGPYELLEKIGEGGFGVVFLAEQVQPVRRRVALKVIKPGMDTRQVIARFEAERQALAMMDHPNIAKVHDAGATENGRPYFVMELVQGVPITEYCDKCHLTTNERLKPFITVCQAVQHAHQKGIIHRDLKPTNILVAIQDGHPAPKIIDFGVAKAIDQRLTQHTLTTTFAQMVGTPLYMSPEQAELSPLGVDTRSDIYSLGVLLYELLSGTTPFDKERLHAAAFDELRRIILDEEPPPPSSRISTLAADLAMTVAERRRTDARRLSHTIRGELDWIVMKCLEKDRNRRYETPNSLARDIERYLRDEAVQACPPSMTYRLRKFVRRNREPVLAATLVTLALLGGIAASARQAVRATRAEGQALQAQGQAHRAVNDYFSLISEDEALRYEPALQPLRRKLLESALAYYEEFVREEHSSPQLRAEMAATCSRIALLTFELGTGEDMFVWLEKSNAIIQELLDEQHDVSKYPSLTAGQRWLVGASSMWVSDREKAYRVLEKWEQIGQELVNRYPAISGFQNDLAASYLALSKLYKGTDIAKALEYAKKSRHIWETLSHDHPRVPEYRAALASSICFTAILRVYAQQPGALKEKESSEKIYRDLVGEFPDVPGYREGLAQLQEDLGFVREHYGDYENAEAAYRDMIHSYEKLQSKYPTSIQFQLGILRGRMWLGELLWNNDAQAAAMEQFQQALLLGEKIGESDLIASYYFAYFLANCADPTFRDAQRAIKLADKVVKQVSDYGDCWITLGWALYRADQYEAAVKALETGTGMFTNYDTCTAQFFLAMANHKLRKKEEALRCYNMGVAQMNKEYDMFEYRRIRAEAEKLLGIPPTTGSSPSVEPEPQDDQAPRAETSATQTTTTSN
jgi:serine/threonine protein kinase/tetratricopeptide (TPR) repeat protein